MKTTSKPQFIIRSIHRWNESAPCWFCAIHGSTPMFSDQPNARRFDTEQEAERYARAELFTHKAGVFEIDILTD